MGYCPEMDELSNKSIDGPAGRWYGPGCGMPYPGARLLGPN